MRILSEDTGHPSPLPCGTMSADLPTRDGILRARRRVEGRIVRTPLLHGRSDRPLWLKPEVLQRTGSFKIRGALNFIGALTPAERERGVVAYSSGNHAQGVAAAAADYGIPATIVMPDDAPPIKTRNTRRSGATVVTYDRATEVRESIAARIAADTGGVIVPPYDHRLTVEGQGTVGLEILADLEAAGVTAATIAVPTSGGGLAAGIALAVEGSGHRVIVAEPDGYDDHRRSLAAGDRVAIEPTSPSICDALLQTIPGEITFAINRDRLAGAVTATDDRVLAAMRWAVEEARLVVEPGGAVALAAFLDGALPGDGPVVVVLSGGNVDPAILGRALG
jgi:threonine dehydratase